MNGLSFLPGNSHIQNHQDEAMPQSPLAEPLKLPCGAVLPNRLAKAAMTEGLADDQLHATRRQHGGG